MENLFERGEWTPGLHCDPLRKILIALQDRFESLDGLWRMTPELLQSAAENNDDETLRKWEDEQHERWLKDEIPSVPQVYVEVRTVKGMGAYDAPDVQRFLYITPNDTANTQRLCLSAWFNDGTHCTWCLSGENIEEIQK
jgi:hypothetical protein